MPLNYALAGPSSGIKGVASLGFILQPVGTTTDTITFSDGGAGGIFAPTSLSFVSSSAMQNFTYTPPAVGTFTLTLTSGVGDTILGNPATYTATPAYVWIKIQSKLGSSNSEPAQAITFDSPVTAGNLIVVAVTLGGTETPTVNDTLGNSYTQGVNPGNTSLWYTTATSSGPLTVTVAVGTNTGISAAIGEYRYPPGATLSLEGTEHGNASGAGTAVSITSLSVTMPDLVVMAVNLANTTVSSVTPGAPMATTEYISGGGGVPGIQFQEVISPLTSPVVSTATLVGGAAYWTAISGAFLAAMPTYELLGPESVASGSTAEFTLVPTGTITADTVTLSDGGFGGTFAPTTLTFTASSFAQSFVYTPPHAGLATISLASSNSFSVGAAPWAIGIYVPFTLTGPTGGLVGVASTAFTLTPSSTTTDVVTFSDAGAGGTFIPTSLTWTSSSASKMFTYTPSSSGSHTVTPTSQNSAPISGSPSSFFVSAVVTTNYVCKSGTLAIFGTASAAGESNSAWPLANITAVNVDPVIKVNGNTVAIGPATWTETDHSTPIVVYRLNCGSVRSIPMSVAGENYTSPTASASGGGGSGLVLGTPILGVGITSYVISSAATSNADGVFQWHVPGGTFAGGPFSTPAMAILTVSGGNVVSVVPANGAVQGMGGQYDPSVTAFAADFNGATITCNVSNYIHAVPVTSPGSNYTSPPTITITDSTGSGAVAAPIMNGPASSDTVTYTVADEWLTTTLGPNQGATNGVMENFVGVDEGPNGNFGGFRGTPTLKMGGQFGALATTSQSGYLYFGKNKLKSADVWRAGSGTSSFVIDGKLFPVSWTPGGTLACQFYANAGGIGCSAQGTWHLVYDDEFYATPSRAPAATSVFLTEGGQWNLTLTSTSVVGTTVTMVYTTSLAPGTNVSFSDMEFNVVAPSDGLWHLKDQAGVSDPWVFAPGNTPDRSNPWAPDDAMVARLTGPGGSVPACFRAMDTLGGSGGWQNYISAADLPPVDTFSYCLPYAGNPPPTSPPNSSGNPTPSGTAIFNFARFLNTNPAKSSTGDNTYPWAASNKLYSSDSWANSGTDSFGNYLDMTAGGNADDNGSFLVNAPDPNSGILELRSTTPHGLKSRQLVSLFNDGGANIPWTSFGTEAYPADNVCFIYVTGPNTIITTMGLGTGGSGSATQTVDSTAEVAVSIGCFVQVPISPQTCPFQLVAGAAAAFPGSAPWINLGPIGDDSLYTEIANRIAAAVGPTNDVILEFGNEHWNFAAAFHEFPSESQAKNLGRYMPSGTTLWSYWNTNGANIADDGTNDLFYVIKASHAYDVFTAQWVSLGLDPARIKRMIGSQWTSSGSVIKISGYFATYGIPTPFGICVAPYQPLTGRNNNVTPVAAFTGAGYPLYATGNWPCDAINDYFRHTSFYNADNWNVWGSQFPSLPSGVRMCAYESGIDYDFPDSIPFLPQLTEDCLFHPSYYDVLHGYELATQQGSPLVANSGVVLQSYFNLWNDQGLGMPLWHLGQGFSQASGRGLSNSFNTPQGGLAQANSATGAWPFGYSLVNESPGIQLLRDWNAATSGGGGGATGFTFSGPSSGFVAVPVTLSVTPDASVTDVVTLSDSGAGGTFTPSATVTFVTSSATQNPTYTPSATGTKTITATSAAGGTVSGSPLSISVAARGYIVTGSSIGFVGNAIAYTLTPSGATTDTVTFSDASGGGSFSPTSLSWSGTSNAQAVHYTPASAGTKTLTFTSADGGTVVGSPLSLTVFHVSYTLTGPTSGNIGSVLTCTVTPLASATDTITLSHSGSAGTLSTTTLTFVASAVSQTFTFTPSAIGTATITAVSSDGGAITGSPLVITVSLITHAKAAKYMPAGRPRRIKRTG